MTEDELLATMIKLATRLPADEQDLHRLGLCISMAALLISPEVITAAANGTTPTDDILDHLDDIMTAVSDEEPEVMFLMATTMLAFVIGWMSIALHVPHDRIFDLLRHQLAQVRTMAKGTP